MRGQDRPDPLVLVEPHILWIVDGMKLERIDCDQDAADVGVYVAGLKPLAKVLE